MKIDELIDLLFTIFLIAVLILIVNEIPILILNLILFLIAIIIFKIISDYKISRFGHAAVQSGVCPDEAIMLYEDLSRALSGINLESDFHLLYLITPQEKGIYPDFQVIP